MYAANHCCQITMASYTIEQHVQMIKLYYQNEFVSENITRVSPILRQMRWPFKVDSPTSVGQIRTPVRQRNVRWAENIAAVRVSVQENLRQSIPLRAQELGFSQTSTWRILRRGLGLYPYKIQLTQELKVNDHRQRRLFADW
ncbi:hypothetical protein NQ318_017188 [Aromia moschata]|uniref:Transposase Tc1-like domain-containing protein n=1 Tax=Aromia moschata TaxID=1265417 RepID=A0AAV8YPD7_9CUCU|nr:hypothetical protein NQ318_017188 [Aromia moschata]